MQFFLNYVTWNIPIFQGIQVCVWTSCLHEDYIPYVCTISVLIMFMVSHELISTETWIWFRIYNSVVIAAVCLCMSWYKNYPDKIWHYNLNLKFDFDDALVLSSGQFQHEDSRSPAGYNTCSFYLQYIYMYFTFSAKSLCCCRCLYLQCLPWYCTHVWPVGICPIRPWYKNILLSTAE